MGFFQGALAAARWREGGARQLTATFNLPSQHHLSSNTPSSFPPPLLLLSYPTFITPSQNTTHTTLHAMEGSNFVDSFWGALAAARWREGGARQLTFCFPHSYSALSRARPMTHPKRQSLRFHLIQGSNFVGFFWEALAAAGVRVAPASTHPTSSRQAPHTMKPSTSNARL